MPRLKILKLSAYIALLALSANFVPALADEEGSAPAPAPIIIAPAGEEPSSDSLLISLNPEPVKADGPVIALDDPVEADNTADEPASEPAADEVLADEPAADASAERTKTGSRLPRLSPLLSPHEGRILPALRSPRGG